LSREFVQCPICKEKQEKDECTFATVEKVVGDTTYICCCETLVKKVKKE
jgi:hypothetical protein